MKIRGHGNAVAIALAGLAVVMAATGTAVAVTSGRVTITDPKYSSHVARVGSTGRLAVAGTGTIVDPKRPSQVARVNASGRLLTAGPTSTINLRQSAFAGDASAVVGPTTASIAVSAISYDNAYNLVYTGTNYNVSLVRTTVGAGGTCFDTDAVSTFVRSDGVSRGGTFSESFPVPLQFSAVAGKPYCIGVRTDFVDTSHPTPYYALIVSVSGFVTSGTYTAPAALAAARPKLRR